METSNSIGTALLAAIALGMTACSGGGGGGGSNTGNNPASGLTFSGSSGTSYTPGIYMPAAQFKGMCAAPRAGTSDRAGRTLDENLWLRSWTNETYLWYSEVADTNPGALSARSYFDILKTNAITPSGRDKDQFHFWYDTAVWQALSQSGTEIGYGAEWVAAPPIAPSTRNRIVVAYTHPNEPASRAPALLQRGEEIRSIDGIAIASVSTAQLNAALFPATPGESHTFSLLSTSGGTRNVTLVAEEVTLTPVMNVKQFPSSGGPVGYLQFNDHLAQSELALVNAVNTLKGFNVTSLIIDMRYNGGGYLDIAAELAYMIVGGGTVPTAGMVFENTQFNDKQHRTADIFGRPIDPTPFYTRAQDFSAGTGPLPTLGLTSVYILSGAGTCSASESLINGLRGIGVPVFLIGSTTCGKPYGFYGTDNCGTTYFSIQFQTVNALGFGSYADGFIPQNRPNIPVSTPPQSILPGCSVADDFTHDLGNQLEGRLAAALAHRATGICPTPTSVSQDRFLKSGAEGPSDEDGIPLKSLLRENRWY